MSLMLSCRRWLAVLCVAALAGCATAPATAPHDQATGPWSGRLALQVKDRPEQSFSAMFELRGSAATGGLTLTNPLGGTIAVLSWSPGSATLRDNNGRAREFESVDALVTQATGSAIPVAALFDWLRGVPTPVPGWRPELSQLPQGRISATRLEPPPETDLRVALDR